jgi:drug/metabolite transporter (DMT)-like permease
VTFKDSTAPNGPRASGMIASDGRAVASRGRADRVRPLLVIGVLVVVNVIWAGQFIAVKYVEPFLGPFAIAFLPFLLVTPLMVPLLYRSRRHPTARPTAADWVRFGIAGGLGQVVCMGGMTWAGVVGSASNCSILYLLSPVLSAAMASFMLGERLSPLRLVALAIGLVGVLVMSADSLRDADFLTSRFMKGNLLMLVGCLGACFYNVFCKRLMDTFDELDVLIYTYITATPVGIAIVQAVEPDAFGRLAALDARGWLAFLFLAIMVLGLSMIMFFAVLKSLPVTVALASTYMTPVFGVMLAMLLLGERLTPVNLLGSGMVLAATVLVMRYDAGADRQPAGGG